MKHLIEDLFWFPDFLSEEEATLLYHQFEKEIPWEIMPITIFGKTVSTPRKEAFFSENNLNYSYSGKKLTQNAFTPEITALKTKIEQLTGEQFNAVLINFYRDGNDSNGWHADNEKELGKEPIIASLSLGTTRRFDLKQISSGEKISIDLIHGSLLLMGKSIQPNWKHCIAKSKRVITGRINLTFRKII